MEVIAAHVGGPGQGFSCSLLPGTLPRRGSLLSLVFWTEDVWRRCNQFIETAEFLIGVPLSQPFSVWRRPLIDSK